MFNYGSFFKLVKVLSLHSFIGFYFTGSLLSLNDPDELAYVIQRKLEILELIADEHYIQVDLVLQFSKLLNFAVVN